MNGASERWGYWLMGFAAGGIVAFGLQSCFSSAKAQEWEDRRKRPCEYTNTCQTRSYGWCDLFNCYTYRKPYYRQRAWRHYPTRTYSYEQRDPSYSYGPKCKESLAVVGEERYGNERAREAAAAIWMERVRFLHGVRYLDIKNARHTTYECSRSSTGNRASEKTQEVVGRYLEQCEVRATPCRAEREEGR